MMMGSEWGRDEMEIKKLKRKSQRDRSGSQFIVGSAD